MKKEPFGVLFFEKKLYTSSQMWSIGESSYRTKRVDENRSTPL